MLTIDGSQGEGGGQILRTSLAMSILTRTPVRLVNIRAGRAKPGLLRQHLTAVEAARTISAAEVEGASLGSTQISFSPHGIYGGEHRFAIGSAGSAGLVMQTVLPPLLYAGAPSTVRIEGGTHNSKAPPFEFLERSFLPLLARMGGRARLELERPGFYPAGGGKMLAHIQPAERLSPLVLTERGELVERRVRALVANLPLHVGRRELDELGRRMGWAEHGGPERRARFTLEELKTSIGPGNALMVELEHSALTEVYTGFGERGVPAERVAGELAAEVQAYLASGAPVGEHLADQLLIPMTLAGGGRFTTHVLSPHTETNIAVLQRFTDVQVKVERDGERVHLELSGSAHRPGA